MKQLNKLSILFVLAFAIGQLHAQPIRYLDEVFSGVNVESDVTYATNITVLTDPPSAQGLQMDVYTPEGDDATDRPVVVYFHTGSFLPQYFNGQVTGSRSDSTVVEICTRLAKLGYVAIAATYRQGWNPAALGPDGQDIRTGTLLNAAYRGIQDARACIRYLRWSVDQDDNPYGIDTDKICLWGQGTGGYISLGAAYLDRFEEVNIDKFISQETALPYVDTTLSSNVFGTTETPLNIPNNPSYSNDFALAVNMGGALGDLSWMDNQDNEPVTIGYHVVNDPFAPFGFGAVIVPTTGDFVVNVDGTRTVVEKANDLGNNAPIATMNAALLADGDVVTNTVEAYKPVVLPTPPFQPEGITIGEDNMYPFVTGSGPASGPWDWWDKPTLDAVIAAINMVLPPDSQLDSDQLHNDGLLTNPDMSAEKARRYIDTIMLHYVPRACAALDLTECVNELVNTEDLIDAKMVDLTVAPNPASDRVFIQSAADFRIKDVRVFDAQGLMVRTHFNVNDNTFELERRGLPTGMYFVRLAFEEGVVVQKVMFK